MTYSDEKLLTELEATITALDAMTANIVANCPPFLSSPYSLKDRNGNPALAPLVIARAQAFAAYTTLRVERSQQARHEEQVQRAAQERLDNLRGSGF